jgi:betaine lipid synthase
MLALAAAQLRFKAEKEDGAAGKKRIWVDVGFSSALTLF